MKKTIIKGIIFIILGFFIGEFIFGDKLKDLKKLSKKETFYFLQEGVYNSKNNINSISNKVIDYKDNKYYVYVGITKDLEVLEKLKEIYKEEGLKVIEKEKYLSSIEFSTNVDQFDLLIKSTKDKDQILTIEEVVLANYEEIIKNSSKTS